MPSTRVPAGPISSSAGSATPCSGSLFRLRWQGARAAARRRAATSSRPTTCRTSIRGRSGCRCSRVATSASWPSRSSSGSRSGRSSAACGALPGPARPAGSGGDRHGASRLCREGHVVVMFPEGTRREKGLRKRHEARWRTGRGADRARGRRAPRSRRRSPGCRTTAAPRPRSASPSATRSSSTISRPCRSTRPPAIATERLSDGDHRARGDARREAAARQSTATRSRTARSTRCRARSDATTAGRPTR